MVRSEILIYEVDNYYVWNLVEQTSVVWSILVQKKILKKLAQALHTK